MYKGGVIHCLKTCAIGTGSQRKQLYLIIASMCRCPVEGSSLVDVLHVHVLPVDRELSQQQLC